jgi:hypothetical protein
MMPSGGLSLPSRKDVATTTTRHSGAPSGNRKSSAILDYQGITGKFGSFFQQEIQALKSLQNHPEQQGLAP